ncbi:MAG TPA: rhomboid family intramembrane serine protease [Puia sp.]|nr:rhomboid family intramembrane serine protease [Puia sp.]
MAEFRPGGFRMIPPVIKNLIIVNVLVWLAQITIGNSNTFSMEDLFALHDVHSPLFKPHQLITYMFMHDPSSIFHLLFNMYALWMFGAVLENFWGSKRFLIFYILCGLGAAIAHLAILYYQNAKLIAEFNLLDPETQQTYIVNLHGRLNEATLGASGAVFGCLAAFGYLFPNSTLIMLPIPIPIKAKWFVLIYAGIELFAGFRSTAGDNVAHWAHLGGAVVGILIVLYWRKTDRRNFY